MMDGVSMRHKIIGICFWTLVFISSLPACKKNYSIEPVGPKATMTQTPSLTPTQTSTATATSTAITWYSAEISRQQLTDYSFATYEFQEAYVMLAVNGLPEVTAGVTIYGSDGTAVSLPYSFSMGESDGVTYADYGVMDSGVTAILYNPGVVYTFVSVTSAGTASASVTAPGGITHAEDGSETSWSVRADSFSVLVTNSMEIGTFSSFCSIGCGSSFAIPSSAYADCGDNILETICINTTHAMNNGVLLGDVTAIDNYSNIVAVTASCTPVTDTTYSSVRPRVFSRPSNRIGRRFK
jgi:hypothetical protein